MDSTDSFTPDSTYTLFTVAAVAAAGTKHVAHVPVGSANFRFGRLLYTPNNGNLSTGSFTAFITKDADLYTSYPDNITIS
jgi:hypothetical protein